jgi:hypothetical protein
MDVGSAPGARVLGDRERLGHECQRLGGDARVAAIGVEHARDADGERGRAPRQRAGECGGLDEAHVDRAILQRRGEAVKRLRVAERRDVVEPHVDARLDELDEIAVDERLGRFGKFSHDDGELHECSFSAARRRPHCTAIATTSHK